MTFQIIIRGSKNHRLGRTRSEQEENIRKEWGRTISDEQLDKLKFMEKRRRDVDGSKDNFTPGHIIDALK